MSTSVAAVLFDAGNTLVYVDPERLAALFGGESVETDAGGVARAELEARRLLHDAVRRGHAGTEPEVWQDYFTELFSGSGVRPEAMSAVGERVREEHARRHLWTHVEPGTEEALVRLRDAGYRLGVISNADGRVEGVLEAVGLARHFEFVIDSEVFGAEKPDPTIFQEGCARMGLPEASCLYVGDLFPVDYLGATSAGLPAVLLDPLGVHGERAPTVGTLGELPAHVARLNGAA